MRELPPVRVQTHRVVNLRELVARFPNAFFNEDGELIYDKKRNHYIIPEYLRFLGTWHPGFRRELYIEKLPTER